MAGVSKEEYLRKYLSGNSADDKKKKRRPKSKAKPLKARLRIVDDDIDVNSLVPENLQNTLDEDLGDDGPVVVDGIDISPPRLTLDDFKTIKTTQKKGKKWRTLGEDSEPDEEDQIENKRLRHDTDSDNSPPRRVRHDSNTSQSPPRRRRHDSESDQSPPRRRRRDSNSDQSPIRRQRHDSGSDQSPPRRKRLDSESDQSPVRRKKHDSKSVRRRRHDSGSDQSPVRRKCYDSDEDLSPPRKKNTTKSSRKGHGASHSNSDSDLSPPRRDSAASTKTRQRKSRFHSDSDQSPPRKAAATKTDEHGRPMKTLGGATAGLSSAQQMREEAKMMKQREEEMFRKLDDETLGRNAKTVFRERNKKSQKELEKEAAEEAKKAEIQEKYKKWNKGLRQAEFHAAALQDTIHEMSKPVARHRGDEDLEDLLRARDREGDPMLVYLKKKKKPDPKKKELPRYKGPEPPQNRFGIWPGYRWDGVDRSNGFEKQIILKAADKKAIKEIAYKWSVEDM